MHVLVAGAFASNRCDDMRHAPLVESLFAPDVTIDGKPWLSIGFGAHLVPCDSGASAEHMPAGPCHDRVQDGDETGVDCGGSCGTCQIFQPTGSDGARAGLGTCISMSGQ